MQIKIEHGIPMPLCSADGHVIKALRQMKVGDSFVYPRNHQASISGIGQRAGVKLVTRKLNDDTIRVWRVK